jgi:hypothetical protein
MPWQGGLSSIDVTGWQGDGGNQDGDHGAWGPRETEHYGQDPYYLQHDPYGYGGYPTPPPPPRSKLPMIFGVLAIVIIVGAVVTIVLINREAGGTPTAAPSKTEAPKTAEPRPSGSSESTSDPSATSSKPDTRDGWQTVDNTADSGLIYEVPPDWKVVPGSRPSGLGVDFTGTADYGTYRCESRTYVRTFATSGDVQAKDGSDLDLAKTVKDFAAGFGKEAYNESAKVSVPEPEEFDLDGKRALRVAAKVTQRPTVPTCEATEGEVAIVGVLLEEGGEPSGVAMLAVVSDIAGGPVDPATLPKPVAQEVLASLKVG